MGYAAERLGRGIVTDAITTPVVNTSAYFFKKTADLIDFKVLFFQVLKFLSASRSFHVQGVRRKMPIVSLDEFLSSFFLAGETPS